MKKVLILLALLTMFGCKNKIETEVEELTVTSQVCAIFQMEGASHKTILLKKDNIEYWVIANNSDLKKDDFGFFNLTKTDIVATVQKLEGLEIVPFKVPLYELKSFYTKKNNYE